jgi:hypothetical protein
VNDRDDYRGLLLDPARAPRVAVLVVDALTKLRAARLAEAEALSALLKVFIDIGAERECCDTASRAAPEAGCAAAHPPVAAESQYLSVRQLSDRIPYAEHTIRNLMTAGALREGQHYFKRRGRVMFSWPVMCRWVEERRPLAAETLPMVRSRRRGR